VPLGATRDGQAITIHGNTHLRAEVADSQVRSFSVTEDARHVEGFAAALAELVAAAKAERNAGG